MHRIRLVAYLWPLPYTLLGITCGLLLGGSFPVSPTAITLGHVVLGRDETMLQVTRRHERVHVGQYERWGLAFIPAYLLASACLYLLGRDGYRDNPFELEAYAVDEAE